MKKTLILFMSILFLASISLHTVRADDDDDDYRKEYKEDWNDDVHEKYEYYKEQYKYYKEKWKDGGDEDDREKYKYYKEQYKYYKEKRKEDDYYKNESDYNNQINSSENMISHWFLWTRMTTPIKGEAPIPKPKNIIFQNNATEKQLSLYSIPMQGELYIPGKKVGEFLGAKTVFYPTSQILEISGDYSELIFRVGSNASYENNIKTPIPAKAMFFNGDDVYLPISVVANGLGYSVDWDAEQQIIYLQKMNQ